MYLGDAISGKGVEMSESVTPGWVRLTLQVPAWLAKDFRLMAQSTGTAGVKYAGTAAVATMLGLPDPVRDELIRLVVRRTWSNPEALPMWEVSEMIKEEMLEYLKEKQDEGGKEFVATDEDEKTKWYISRILDPEITPPPGQKASDRAKGEPKDKGRKSG